VTPGQVRELTGRIRDYARQYGQLRAERERELLSQVQHNGAEGMARAAWSDLDDALNQLERELLTATAPAVITLLPERYGGKRS